MIGFIIIFSCCGNSSQIDGFDTKRDSISFSDKNTFDNYIKLSDDEKIHYCKEQIKNSNLTIGAESNIFIPDNSIFYIITDNKLLKNLGFEKFYSLPIIVRFSDRKVMYSGNRFADGGVSRRNVGAAYDSGYYEYEGMVRDIQIYEMSKKSDNLFVPSALGYQTNSLGEYNVYDFKRMKETGGLPGYLDGLWKILDHFGNIADDISYQKIDLKNKNFFFYSDGSFTENFNGVYLKKRLGTEK